MTEEEWLYNIKIFGGLGLSRLQEISNKKKDTFCTTFCGTENK